jgi:thioester reductase-like protein
MSAAPPKKKPAAKRAPRRSKSTGSASRKRKVLVTGYPGFIGKRLVRTLLQREPNNEYYLLVQDKFVEDARKYVKASNPRKNTKVQILVGDIADMHLGLSADELQRLTREVTDIYHLAAISYLGVPDDLMWQVNVQGTVNLLELAEESRSLVRFNYVSTCFVSGDREGVITEEDLDCGQGFRNLYERTKFEAEKKVRAAMGRLPISIFRPSIVVGDSQTGEIGRFDGPYYLGILLVSSPLSVPLPLPGDGGAPLNMVPVDFVVDSILHLSQHSEAVGLAFHLVDPNPLSARAAYQLIARCTGMQANKISLATGLPRSLLTGLTKLVLSVPGLEKISRAPRQAIDYVTTMTMYNSRNTMRLLKGQAIECPPFESYADNLVSYVREYYEARRLKREVEEDPLA